MSINKTPLEEAKSILYDCILMHWNKLTMEEHKEIAIKIAEKALSTVESMVLLNPYPQDSNIIDPFETYWKEVIKILKAFPDKITPK